MIIVLFLMPIFIFGSLPSFVAGDVFFAVEDTGSVYGPFTVQSIIILLDGSYPPTDGQPCPGDATPMAKSTWQWQPPFWAVCVTPPVTDHKFAWVEIVSTSGRIFADGFESGDTSAWSKLSSPFIFADGFESGDTTAWSG